MKNCIFLLLLLLNIPAWAESSNFGICMATTNMCKHWIEARFKKSAAYIVQKSHHGRVIGTWSISPAETERSRVNLKLLAAKLKEGRRPTQELCNDEIRIFFDWEQLTLCASTLSAANQKLIQMLL